MNHYLNAIVIVATVVRVVTSILPPPLPPYFYNYYNYFCNYYNDYYISTAFFLLHVSVIPSLYWRLYYGDLASGCTTGCHF